LQGPRITRNNANILKAFTETLLKVTLFASRNADASVSESSFASIRVFRGQKKAAQQRRTPNISVIRVIRG